LIYHLSDKYIKRKVYSSWGMVAALPAVWIIFPFLSLASDGHFPTLGGHLIFGLILAPIVLTLLKPAKKESRYWRENGKKIFVELAEENIQFHGPDEITSINYSSVNDLKLDVQWKRLRKIHIETNNGHIYVIQGYEDIEGMLDSLIQRCPGIFRSKK